MWNLRRNLPWNRREEESGRNPLMSLQQEIDDIFTNFWRRSPRMPNLFTGTEPSTDVSETDDEVEVSIELPGMDEKDIEVNISDEMLTVRGEKKAEREEKKKDYYLSERTYGSFHRAVPLPPGINTDKAEATFKKGVLTIRLPKTEEAKSRMRRIEVKQG